VHHAGSAGKARLRISRGIRTIVITRARLSAVADIVRRGVISETAHRLSYAHLGKGVSSSLPAKRELGSRLPLRPRSGILHQTAGVIVPQDKIEVRPVRTRQDMNAFVQASFAAQGDNPKWAPPLNMEVHQFFDRRRSPFAKENEIACFVALRDGAPVGRIAAIVNSAHLARYNDRTGHFGFIEAIDDREVFARLTDEASRNLKQSGLTRMSGPYSASINHEVGLLIEGLDQPHMIRTNYAPPYYARHLEALKFTKVMDLIAFGMDTGESLEEHLVRIRAIHDKWKHRDELKTYGLTYRSWHTAFKKLLHLFNDAWAENWGAVPISPSEVDFIAQLMLPVIKPSWIRIAEWRGEPIAIVAQIPNANEAFAKLKGKLLPFGWLRLMSHLHVTGARTSRIPIAGIVRKWRDTRVGQMAITRLMLESAEIARANDVRFVEMSWVLETNLHAIQGIELFGSAPTRKFRIFERAL
jgi:hypothetical protein